MKKLPLVCAAAALACLSGAAFARGSSAVVAGPAMPGSSHVGPGGFMPGRHGGTSFSSDWYSGGWPDRPQTQSGWLYGNSHRPDHHDHHDGGAHHGGHWNDGYGWGYGYPALWGYDSWGDGDGHVLTEPSPDMFGFYGAGGDVTTVNGAAVYDYDRGYPYEWYRGGPAAGVTVHRSAGSRCEEQAVPDGRGTGTAVVRICRR